MTKFVWDDRYFKLIEEGAEYDEKHFTIVRKMFIRWNARSSKVKDEILCAFQVYGKVENVEILKEETSIHIATDDTKLLVSHEAYVLFESSLDAHRSLKAPMYPKNLVTMVPADTWHQPDYNKSNEIPLPGILKCDHQCELVPLTRAIDNLSLQHNEVLCKHSVVDFELEMKSGTKLNEIRQLLRNINSFVDNLTLSFYAEFDDDEDDDEVDCIGRGDFQRRVMEVIGMNGAGPKLESLTINGISGFSRNVLICLSPMLKQLKTLAIDTRCCNILYLLHTFCPNLIEFRLIGRKWDGDGGNEPVQPWPSLQCLGLKGFVLEADHETHYGKRFRKFLSMTQLEALEIDLIADNSMLKIIGKSMRTLKFLSFSRETFDSVGGMIDQLVRCKHLASIVINTWIFKTNDFKSLLACAEFFSKKKHLKMSTLLQNYVLSEDEPIHIGHFPVKYHDDCSCHGPNSRAMSFGDHTETIDLPKNKPSIAIMVGVARHLKDADDTLASRIFTMFKGTKKFYPNVLKTTVIEESDRFIYVHLSSVGL